MAGQKSLNPLRETPQRGTRVYQAVLSILVSSMIADQIGYPVGYTFSSLAGSNNEVESGWENALCHGQAHKRTRTAAKPPASYLAEVDLN